MSLATPPSCMPNSATKAASKIQFITANTAWTFGLAVNPSVTP